MTNEIFSPFIAVLDILFFLLKTFGLPIFAAIVGMWLSNYCEKYSKIISFFAGMLGLWGILSAIVALFLLIIKHGHKFFK